MSKVVLTREQADALESLIRFTYDKNEKSDIVAAHAYRKEQWINKYAPLTELDLDTVIKALYIGYEVQTPEKKLVELFNKTRTLGVPAYTNGIKDTLNTLGITIPGINGDTNE